MMDAHTYAMYARDFVTQKIASVFEIYEENEIYYFVPEDKRSSVMWYIVSGLLKENQPN